MKCEWSKNILDMEGLRKCALPYTTSQEDLSDWGSATVNNRVNQEKQIQHWKGQKEVME